MTDVVITEVGTDQVAKRGPARPVGDGVDDQLVAEVVEQARAAGLQLTGEGGLLQQLTNRVLEAALDGEIGPVQIEVPRDRDGTFEPQIVRKRLERGGMQAA